MRSTIAGETPLFRASTIVATALSPDPSGDLSHNVVVDHSGPAAAEIVYTFRPKP